MSPDSIITIPIELSGGGIAMFDRQHYAEYETDGDLRGDKFETEAKQNKEIHDGRAITALADNGKYDVSLARLGFDKPIYQSPRIVAERVIDSQGFWLEVPSGELVITDFAGLRDWRNAHHDARGDGFFSTTRFMIAPGALRLCVEAYLVSGNPFNRASVALKDDTASEATPPENLRSLGKTELRFVRQIVFNINPMTRRMALSMRKTLIFPPDFQSSDRDYKEALARLKATLTKKEG